MCCVLIQCPGECAGSPGFVGEKPGKGGDRPKYPLYGLIPLMLFDREMGRNRLSFKNFVTQASSLQPFCLLSFFSLGTIHVKY